MMAEQLSAAGSAVSRAGAGERPATLVFDLFGVIARTQDVTGQRVLEDLFGSASDTADFWSSYWAARPAYDRGDTSGVDYWREVGRRLGVGVDPELVERLVAADVKSWSGVDAAMVELVDELSAQGRELVLLSNAPVEIAASMRRSQPWLAQLAAVVFSCDVHAAKPEPTAFAHVERAVGRTPGQLMMIDDRAENIAAARERGWQGVQFSGLRALLQAL